MTAQPRVLVTDAEERSVLAACRGLAEAGYHVTAVAGRTPAAAHWSRSVRERLVLRDPREDPAGYVERLARVVAGRRFDVLVPGTEASLLPISQHRAAIEQHVRLGLPPHDVLLRAVDKLVLQAAAESVGLAPPRSITCASLDQALAAVEDVGRPALAKPARSFRPEGKRLRQEVARVVVDEPGLAAAVEALGLPLTVQAYVPGGLVLSLAGVRVGTELRGLTAARYARTFPELVGSAAMAVTVDAPGDVLGPARELLSLIGWEGLFELELLELGGGAYGAIDLNPRPFGWMSLAVGAGANLPAIWCDHVLGRTSVPLGPARVGVRYRWEEAEIRLLLRQLRRGRLGAALAVLRPYRRVVHAQARLGDPGPLLARLLFLAKKAVLRGQGRGAPGERGGAQVCPYEPVAAEQPDAWQGVDVGSKLAS